MRQQVTVGTRTSKAGDPVSAVLLSPILDRHRVLLPSGSELEGRVSLVRKMGLGFRRQTASLGVEFHTVQLGDGSRAPIEARVRRVEAAKEWVAADGRIHGIRPVTNVSSSLAVAAWRLLVVAPAVGASVWATKLVFAPAPDTEIALPPGTEYRLELTRPLKLEDSSIASSDMPAPLLSGELKDETRAALEALPSHWAERVSGEPADLVNLVLVGSVTAIERAFHAAGWSTADRKAPGSIVRTYFSIILRRGYKKAPMTTMVMDGSRSDFELQKGLNTVAKRHHLRIWRRPATAQGESVWVAAATEDTGFKLSFQPWKMAHEIDGHVDAERTKVVDDLLYTGCVAEAGLIERDNLPPTIENGTGTALRTDGRVAVLRIGQCSHPRVMPGVGAVKRTGAFRFLGASLRTELVRSNFVSLAYNGVRLTSATRRALFGKPSQDDTGAALTRQQSAWLSVK